MSVLELSTDGRAWEVTAVHGRVALSEWFKLHVRAFVHEEPPACADLVGQRAVVTLRDPFERSLVFHGLVASASKSPSFEGHASFEITVSPHLLPLAVGRNYRVFQDLSAVDIVKKVLETAGILGDAARWSLAGSYPTRAYCAQYQETDWDFIARLLAEEGIYSWFDLAEDATRIVFADDSTVAPTLEGDAQVPFNEGGGLRAERDSVSHVVQRHALVPDAVRLRDYNFDKPRLDLDARAGSGPREVYDFPGRFRVPAEGERLARVRLEALRARRVQVSGDTRSARLLPGLVFELTEHPVSALNRAYLVESVALAAVDTRHRQGEPFSAQWTAIPADVPYRQRAQRLTRSIAGPQTGVVVGPAGEEIHTDSAGRVRVQFHWDREGQRDERASTWMRVGQFAIGGSMLIPRTGWDVLVHHDEGDVDAPFVLSHLYDGEHPVPYPLPANRTRTAWQTATTPGGGSSNEVRFEDKAGSEELFINASKDMNVTIGHDKTETVGVNHAHTVGSNLDVTVGTDLQEGIGASQSVTVGGSESLTVSGNRGAAVGGSEVSTVGGSRTVTVSSGSSLDATGGRTLVVGGSMMSATPIAISRMTLGTLSQTVGGSWINAAGAGLGNMTGGAYAETVGGAKVHVGAKGCTLSVKGAAAETVGGAYVIAAGGNAGETATGSLAITVGGAFLGNAPTIEIEAESEISVRCGGASLTITSGRVEVKAPTLASPAAKIDKGASAIEHN